MSIFSKNIESASKDLQTSQQEMAEWQQKADATKAEAAALEAGAGAAILDDEDAAETISLRIQTLERKARAYDSAVLTAAQKVRKAEDALLDTEAREHDRLGKEATKQFAAHNGRVGALLKELKDLDGVDYVIAMAFHGGEIIGHQEPKSTGLSRTANDHAERAAILRYFVKTGKRPAWFTEITNELGIDIRRSGDSDLVTSYPDSLLAVEAARRATIDA